MTTLLTAKKAEKFTQKGAKTAASRIVTVVNEAQQVNVPAWVVDVESFRRWADTEDYPEKARIWFLHGRVWIDMSREQLLTHLQVKNEFAFAITAVVKEGDLGLFLPDGAFFTNVTAAISGKPDAVFVGNDSLESGRVKLVEGRQAGYVELEGTPDLVLEVVSRSSVPKDTVTLRQAYWQAGIREYWLVDARREPLQFDILRYTASRYVAVRKHDGWIKSSVLNKQFQLSQRTTRRRLTEFVVMVR